MHTLQHLGFDISYVWKLQTLSGWFQIWILLRQSFISPWNKRLPALELMIDLIIWWLHLKRPGLYRLRPQKDVGCIQVSFCLGDAQVYLQASTFSLDLHLWHSEGGFSLTFIPTTGESVKFQHVTIKRGIFRKDFPQVEKIGHLKALQCNEKFKKRKNPSHEIVVFWGVNFRDDGCTKTLYRNNARVKFMLVIIREDVCLDLHTVHNHYISTSPCATVLHSSVRLLSCSSIIYDWCAVVVCWQLFMKLCMLWHISKTKWMKSNLVLLCGAAAQVFKLKGRLVLWQEVIHFLQIWHQVKCEREKQLRNGGWELEGEDKYQPPNVLKFCSFQPQHRTQASPPSLSLSLCFSSALSPSSSAFCNPRAWKPISPGLGMRSQEVCGSWGRVLPGKENIGGRSGLDVSRGSAWLTVML